MVILYVNGEKKNISSSAVSGYLQSIPADKIDRIEIITDPGSNYRSDGNSGIINLVLKKDADQGLKGNVAIDDVNVGANIAADYQLTEKQSIGAMVDFSYQKNDGDLFSTAQYSPLNSNLIDSTIYSENYRDGASSFFSSNLNYRLKTGDKKGLSFYKELALKECIILVISRLYNEI